MEHFFFPPHFFTLGIQIYEQLERVTSLVPPTLFGDASSLSYEWLIPTLEIFTISPPLFFINILQRASSPPALRNWSLDYFRLGLFPVQLLSFLSVTTVNSETSLSFLYFFPFKLFGPIRFCLAGFFSSSRSSPLLRRFYSRFFPFFSTIRKPLLFSSLASQSPGKPEKTRQLPRRGYIETERLMGDTPPPPPPSQEICSNAEEFRLQDLLIFPSRCEVVLTFSNRL